MAGYAQMRCGDFKSSYAADTTIFATPVSRGFVLLGIALLALAPLEIAGIAPLSDYWIELLIQIGTSASPPWGSTSWSASPARSRSATPPSSASARSPRPG